MSAEYLRQKLRQSQCLDDLKDVIEDLIDAMFDEAPEERCSECQGLDGHNHKCSQFRGW